MKLNMKKLLVFTLIAVYAIFSIFALPACKKAEDHTSKEAATQPETTEAPARESYTMPEINADALPEWLKDEYYSPYLTLDISNGVQIVVFTMGVDIEDLRCYIIERNDEYYNPLKYPKWSPMAVEQAKELLALYQLPDESVVLRPYINYLSSGLTFPVKSIAETAEKQFEGRYQVGDEIKFGAK